MIKSITYEKKVQELCEAAHEAASAAGWLEGPPVPFAGIALLINSEISEALEDYRNHRKIDEIYYEETPEGLKPCGIPVELADFLIRIAQHCGTKKYHLWEAVISQAKHGPIEHPEDFISAAAHAMSKVSRAFEYMSDVPSGDVGEGDELTYAISALGFAFDIIVRFCELNSIDIWSVIALKMAFNKMRGQRHGGKKC